MHKELTVSETIEDVLSMFTILDFDITKEKLVDLIARTIDHGEVRDTNLAYHGKYQCPVLYVRIGCLKNQYTITTKE